MKSKPVSRDTWTEGVFNAPDEAAPRGGRHRVEASRIWARETRFRGVPAVRLSACPHFRSGWKLGGQPQGSDEPASPVSQVVISICDTGPVVAYLNRNDPHHEWAVALMMQLEPPLLTYEPVLTEAYFLREDGLKGDPLFDMIERDALRLDFALDAHRPRVRVLMSRFESMDLADAALVVMTEQHSRCQVIRVDRKDFSIYRRHDRQTIDFVARRRAPRRLREDRDGEREVTRPVV
jgi:predicted nucleic acid-binding protein